MNPHKMLCNALILGALCATPAMAQSHNSQTAFSTVSSTATETTYQPRTIISYGGAPLSSPEQKGYQHWDEFAQENPQVVRQLSFNPRLINDPDYARNHPEFEQFLKDNPKVAEDLAEHPGNYMPEVEIARGVTHSVEQ
ncbi:MAG: hypothetical protein IVW54_02010 [Candidatus Binataceae bacterium]|nr:hypothetical protein [Candidatus Binataceae bacterium]